MNQREGSDLRDGRKREPLTGSLLSSKKDPDLVATRKAISDRDHVK